MAYQIVIQPNGKLCLWSTVSNVLVMTNATEQDIIDTFVADQIEEITKNVKRIIRGLEDGKNPYYQFTMSWDDICEEYEETHGEPLIIKE